MKKLIILLLVVMPLFVSAQDKKENSNSKTNAFVSRDGTLIKKELYPIVNIDKSAEIKEVAFTVVLYTDLFTNEKMACLQINTVAYSSLTRQVEASVGVLDEDEVGKCLDSFKFIKDKIVTTTPLVDTDCQYLSRDFVKMGVSVNNKQEWVPFLLVDRWNPQSTVILKNNQLDKIILNLTLAKAKLSELLVRLK